MKIFIILKLIVNLLCLDHSSPSSSYVIEHESISQKKARSLIEKYQEPKYDLISLLFDHPEPTCLNIMKELRLEDKKKHDPYARWRLIQVVSPSEIYFENTFETPYQGYKLHRLKQYNNTFYHTTLEYQGKRPNSSEIDRLIIILKQEPLA